MKLLLILYGTLHYGYESLVNKRWKGFSKRYFEENGVSTFDAYLTVIYLTICFQQNFDFRN